MQNISLNASQLNDVTFFRFSVHRWGNRAKIADSGALEEYLRLKRAPDGETPGANSVPTPAKALTVDRVSSTKELLQSKALDEINEVLNDVKDKLCGKYRGIAQPSFIFKGFWTIKKSLVARAEQIMSDANGTLKAKRAALVADYEDAIKRAETTPVKGGGLGPLFVRADYPPADTVAGKFWFDSDYLTIGVNDDIPEEIKQQKQAEWTRKREDGLKLMMEGLRVAFAELIDHACEKLTVQPGEKPRVFRDSTIENIRDFIASFSAKNLGDSQLEDLVKKAEEIVSMGDSDPDRLRKSLSARDNVAQQFAKVQAALDTMITDRKSRKFDFSDDSDSQG